MAGLYVMTGSVGCCDVLFRHVSFGDVIYYDIMLLTIDVNQNIASASFASHHLDLLHFPLRCKQTSVIDAVV